MEARHVLCVIAIGVAAALVTPALGHTSEGMAARGAAQPTDSRFLEPTTVSSSCWRDAQRADACALVMSFFRAVNARRFPSACALLGERLLAETGGAACPRFLAFGVPVAMPWAILDAAHAGRRVSVLVALGQSELEHVRMRHHRAAVGLEQGLLKILDTRVVR